jgi:hypothetical protein
MRRGGLQLWNVPDCRAVAPLRQVLGTFPIFILPGVDGEP